MNAILLGGACLGALVTLLVAGPARVPDMLDKAEQDRGSMASTISVDAATGEVTEMSTAATNVTNSRSSPHSRQS
jgi:hypothetical protein